MMLLLCIGFGTLTMAQRPQRMSPEEMEKRIEKAKTELNLSDEQYEQWKEVHEKYGEEIKQAIEERDREKGKKIQENMGKELETILTDEQKLKFEEMRKNQRKRKGSKRG